PVRVAAEDRVPVRREERAVRDGDRRHRAVAEAVEAPGAGLQLPDAARGRREETRAVAGERGGVGALGRGDAAEAEPRVRAESKEDEHQRAERAPTWHRRPPGATRCAGAPPGSRRRRT